jgi:hypothetical protein
MIGKAISHFKIQTELDHSGVEVVSKAQDLNIDRTDSLKFVPP